MIGLCSWAMIPGSGKISFRLPSHQFQYAPSKIFGRAPRVNIREV